MTIDRRHTDLVLRVFKELAAAGSKGVTPGAVSMKLRELGEPMGTWAVRGALSTLEADGEIALDSPTGTWHPASSVGSGKKRGTA
jgi:hypothetical protein